MANKILGYIGCQYLIKKLSQLIDKRISTSEKNVTDNLQNKQVVRVDWEVPEGIDAALASGMNLMVYFKDGTSTGKYIEHVSDAQPGIWTARMYQIYSDYISKLKDLPTFAPEMSVGYPGNVTELQGSSGISVVTTNGDKVSGLPTDTPSKYGLLLCAGFGATNQLQVFFSFSTPCYIYSRQKLGGTWRDWRNLYPGTSAASVMSLNDGFAVDNADSAANMPDKTDTASE